MQAAPFHKSSGEVRLAFTLIEMLVALAVLSILLAMLANVVNLTGQAISLSSKKLDAAGQARIVFDRLASDLAARPNRSDLGMLFSNSGGIGADSLQFYSEVSGYSGTRQVAAVGYLVPSVSLAPGAPVFQLERAATGTSWTGGNPLFFLPHVPGSSANTDYEILASDVFRMDFCYLLNTGALSNSNQGASATDYSNVTALVVAVGVLDDKSRKLVSSTQLQQLATTGSPTGLPPCTEGQDPMTGWNNAIIASGFAPGIPRQAVQNIRVYERTFFLGN